MRQGVFFSDVLSIFSISVWAASASFSVPPPFAGSMGNSVEIAPSVWMPRLIMNAYPNSSSWVEVGGRGMDCALDYGDARQSEMGQAVAASGLPRSEFFITTKVPCCPTSPFCEDNPDHEACVPFLPMPNCSTARNTTADIEHDLNTIGLDYVDLLLLHFPCSHWEDTVRTWHSLEAAALSGKARAIGVSNFNRTDLEKLVEVAHIRPAVNQAGFAIGSPQNATIGRDWSTINRCRELGITYEAYGSFGEHHSTVPTSKVDVLNNPTVKRVAMRHNTSTALVAYRWAVQHGMVVLASSANPEHMREDLDVFGLELTGTDMSELDAVGMGTSVFSV